MNDRVVREDFFYHAREVWWCSVGVNVDVETDGKHGNFERPVLIVKKFNKDMFWGIPLTSLPKHGSVYQKIRHAGGSSWAIISQMKTMSTKRLLRKIGMVSECELALIQRKIIRLTIEPPR